jgi:hypothetical protein
MKRTSIDERVAFSISKDDLPLAVRQSSKQPSHRPIEVSSGELDPIPGYHSAEWWLNLESGDTPGRYAQPDFLQNVETSGLVHVRGLADHLREEQEHWAREQELWASVQAPSTLLPEPDPPHKPRRIWLIVCLAAAIGSIAGVALSATLWLSLQQWRGGLRKDVRTRPTPVGAPQSRRPRQRALVGSGPQKMKEAPLPHRPDSRPAPAGNEGVLPGEPPPYEDPQDPKAVAELSTSPVGSTVSAQPNHPAGDEPGGMTGLLEVWRKSRARHRGRTGARKREERRERRRRRERETRSERRASAHGSKPVGSEAQRLEGNASGSLSSETVATLAGVPHSARATAPEDKRPDAGGPTAPVGSTSPPPERETRAAREKPAPKGSSEKGDLVEGLIESAARQPERETKDKHRGASGHQRPRPEEKLRSKLSKRDIDRTMRRHKRRINRCLKKFGLYYKKIQARIVIEGSSGRVATARVLGQYRNAPVGSCIRRRLRRIRFPRFQRGQQGITFTFIIREK